MFTSALSASLGCSVSTTPPCPSLKLSLILTLRPPARPIYIPSYTQPVCEHTNAEQHNTESGHYSTHWPKNFQLCSKWWQAEVGWNKTTLCTYHTPPPRAFFHLSPPLLLCLLQPKSSQPQPSSSPPSFEPPPVFKCDDYFEQPQTGSLDSPTSP